MTKFNQKGFGILETLLIIIAIILAVGVGVYVVNVNKDKNSSESSKTNSSSTVEKTDASKTSNKATLQDYIEINELGIKIKNSDNLTNYTFGPSSTTLNGVDVKESSVTKLFENCGSNATNYALVGLYKESGKFDPNQGPSLFEPVVEFTDFYIMGGRSDGGFTCTTETKTVELEDAIIKASNIIIEAVKNSEKL